MSYPLITFRSCLTSVTIGLTVRRAMFMLTKRGTVSKGRGSFLNDFGVKLFYLALINIAKRNDLCHQEIGNLL